MFCCGGDCGSERWPACRGPAAGGGRSCGPPPAAGSGPSGLPANSHHLLLEFWCPTPVRSQFSVCPLEPALGKQVPTCWILERSVSCSRTAWCERTLFGFGAACLSVCEPCPACARLPPVRPVPSSPSPRSLEGGRPSHRQKAEGAGGEETHGPPELLTGTSLLCASRAAGLFNLSRASGRSSPGPARSCPRLWGRPLSTMPLEGPVVSDGPGPARKHPAVPSGGP